MPSEDDLLRLLAHPNETMAIEHKSWLDLRTNEGKAKLAKEAIALANFGGGIIILGMRPDNNEGGMLNSEPRPAGLPRYNQDDINSSINKYADPEFQCELIFASHPETGVEHAFVVVPADINTPTMSSRDCTGIIAARRCYIRKPGPKSEDPHSAEEWRTLLDRCVRARREDMLNAIRSIVQGQIIPSATATRIDELLDFVQESRERWNIRVERLPADSGARMSLGHYEAGLRLNGAQATSSFNDLKSLLKRAEEVQYTGWPPFMILDQDGLRPRVVGNCLEAWLGPTFNDIDPGPAHADFWRVSRTALFYIRRGYSEDERDRAGHFIDVALPIWRIAEILLYARRLLALFEAQSVDVYIIFAGLQQRTLISREMLRTISSGSISLDNEVTLAITVTAPEIEDNLDEIIHRLLVPLYERFNLYRLPISLVTQQTRQLRRERFR